MNGVDIGKKARSFVRENTVLSIACIAAFATCLFVPPDGAYLDYVDVKTIACLFSILAVVGAMRNLGMFQYAAGQLIRRLVTCRSAVCALVGITLVISMVATNDMALIMMLPLSAATLLAAGWARAIPFAFVMQNLAANLGGMILPFGNPQNLYLFEYFHIDLASFLEAMSLPFAISVVLIALCCAFGVKPLPLAADAGVGASARRVHIDNREHRWLFALVYALLMVLTILAVFRLVPYALSTLVVVVTLAFTDRRAIQTLDYGLLLTFVFFFIFAGNMARIPVVDAFLSGLMDQWPLAVSAGLSQVISNVPAAVLLSHFTEAWQPLLVGVNIGGAGTIVGSLASLITLQHYRSTRKELNAPDEAGMYADLPTGGDADLPAGVHGGLPGAGRFIGVMTAYNFAFLAVLFVVCTLWG